MPDTSGEQSPPSPWKPRAWKLSTGTDFFKSVHIFGTDIWQMPFSNQALQGDEYLREQGWFYWSPKLRLSLYLIAPDLNGKWEWDLKIIATIGLSPDSKGEPLEGVVVSTRLLILSSPHHAYSASPQFKPRNHHKFQRRSHHKCLHPHPKELVR